MFSPRWRQIMTLLMCEEHVWGNVAAVRAQFDGEDFEVSLSTAIHHCHWDWTSSNLCVSIVKFRCISARICCKIKQNGTSVDCTRWMQRLSVLLIFRLHWPSNHSFISESFLGSQYAGITQHHAARLKRRIHPLEADSAPPASRFSLTTHWTMMTAD